VGFRPSGSGGRRVARGEKVISTRTKTPRSGYVNRGTTVRFPGTERGEGSFVESRGRSPLMSSALLANVQRTHRERERRRIDRCDRSVVGILSHSSLPRGSVIFPPRPAEREGKTLARSHRRATRAQARASSRVSRIA